MSIQNVIFDWSGVISCDALQVYRTVNRILQDYKKRLISIDDFLDRISLDFKDFWHKLGVDDAIANIQKLYNKHYGLMKKPNSYPEARPCIEHLSQQGLFLGLVTACPQEYLLQEMEHYGLNGQFKEVVPSVHDKTKALRDLLKLRQLKPQETVYICDMVQDVEAANANGISSVGVATGYHAPKRLMKAGALDVIPDLSYLTTDYLQAVPAKHI